MQQSPPLAWYALLVHGRRERTVADQLTSLATAVFVPTSTERRAWSDRIKTVATPWFPGYVFVQTSLNPAKRTAFLRVRGVTAFAGAHQPPLYAQAIDASQIAALQALVASRRAIDPIDQLTPGTVVRVAQGPLRGVSGIIELGVDGQRRLVVQLALLGRGVRTLLAAEDVISVDSFRS